jgi:thymidylate synthase
MWFRINDKDKLILQASIRSNDAFKAAFMNMFAFTELQKEVAKAISERLGREITPGEYVHFANSYHIYGSYFEQFEGFLTTLKERSFEERVWDSTSDLVQEQFEYGRKRLAEERDG